MEFGSKFCLFEKTQEQEELFEEDSKSYLDFEELEEIDDGQTCYLDILDTSGQSEYTLLKKRYYEESNGFLIVYSINDEQSLVEASEIYNELLKIRKKPIVLLIANKNDLKKSINKKKKKGVVLVPIKKGNKLAKKMGINKGKVFETSAKTGENVNLVFETLVRMIPREGNKYKITILGSGGVGKSSLTLRFVRNSFIDEYDPTIEDVFSHVIKLDNLNNIPKPPPPQQQQMKENGERKKGFGGLFMRKKKKKVRTKRIKNVEKANPNVLSFNIGSSITESCNVAKGKPVYCSKCKSCVNKYCEVKEKEWICNFCSEKNIVDDDFVVPEDDCVEYLIKEAPKDTKDDNFVIFVLDISGSMSQSKEIPTGFGMINVGNREFEATKKMIENLNKTLPREERIDIPRKRDNRYVSRIQCMQTAIDIQLEELAKHHPERKVILITFNNSLTIYGSKGKKTIIEGEEKLKNFELLLKNGKDFDVKKMNNIKKEKSILSKKVFSILENGTTAMGSALTFALGVATQKTDTEIICCTDGITNFGLGAKPETDLSHGERIQLMENSFIDIPHIGAELFEKKSKNQFVDLSVVCEYEVSNPELYMDEREAFFSKLSEIAEQNHTTISGIGIADDGECDLEMLEMLAERTGGDLNLVDPMELVRKMRQILDREKIAKDVKVKIFCDPSLQFKKERNEKIEENRVEYNIGAAHEDENITTEYIPNLKKMEKVKTNVPFQSQTFYTKKNGAKYLRVQTVKKEVTTKRKDAEAKLNVAVIGKHAIKKSSRLAKKGKIRDARLNLQKVQKLNFRAIDYDDQIDEIQEKKAENYNFFNIAKEMNDNLCDMELNDELNQLEEEQKDEKSSSSYNKPNKIKTRRRFIGKKKKKISDKKRSYFYNVEKQELKSASKKKVSNRKKHIGKYSKK